MKDLDEYTPEQVQTLLAEEHWHDELQPVHRVQLTPWQQWVFWGLRIYVVAMCVIVLWAFTAGVHA
ncbi:MAG: hypothetical protein KGJ63_11625 [Pseudomonadota bacterium]|jgi:hypothetical protein|nr:hypothetical protein [Pseudomonadota bacterium]